MKLYKLTDLIIQAILLLSSVIFLLAGGSESRYFWFTYLLLGCWQLLGYLVHWSLWESWTIENYRKTYGKAVVFILFLGLLSCLLVFINIYIIWFYYILLLVVSPLLILFYLMINLLELKNIKHRELIHLK